MGWRGSNWDWAADFLRELHNNELPDIDDVLALGTPIAYQTIPEDN